MLIQNRINKFIEEKKITKTALADAISIDASRLSRILKGKESFTLTQIMDISSIYGVSTDWILFGKEERLEYQDMVNEDKVHYDRLRAIREINDTRKGPDNDPAPYANSSKQDYALSPILLRAAAVFQELAVAVAEIESKTPWLLGGSQDKDVFDEMAQVLEKGKLANKDRSDKGNSNMA